MNNLNAGKYMDSAGCEKMNSGNVNGVSTDEKCK